MKNLILLVAVGIIFSNSLLSQNKLTAEENEDGWKLLFNGNNFNGWTASDGSPISDGWKVIDGAMTAIKDGKGGDIMSMENYSDFDLILDYKIEPGVNSGVKYYFTKYENGGMLGMEYQIIDDKTGEDIHKANHLTGSFYDVLPPDKSKKIVNDPPQWNTLRIVSQEKIVEHWLNGVKILSYERGSDIYKNAVAKSKFNKTDPAFGMVEKGHIMLQEHGGVVSFKNIKIKEHK